MEVSSIASESQTKKQGHYEPLYTRHETVFLLSLFQNIFRLVKAPNGSHRVQIFSAGQKVELSYSYPAKGNRAIGL